MKVIKKILLIMLVAFANISIANAATIKETTNPSDSYDTINNGDILIGITRFTQGTTITGLRAALAGSNYGKFQAKNNLNEELKILVNAGAGGFYQMDDAGAVRKVTTPTNIFTYYVNNQEKRIDIPYLGSVNQESLPGGIRYDGTKFSVPATQLDFSITETSGAIRDFVSTPYSANNHYDSELRGHTISYNVFGTEIDNEVYLLDEETVEPTNPVLGTNTFTGWIDASTNNNYVFGTTINKNIVLNAVFTGNSTINVHPNNGDVDYEITGVLDAASFNNNLTTIQNQLVIPTATGKHFVKWCTDSECATEFNKNTTLITDDMDLYASLEFNEYTLVLDTEENGMLLGYDQEIDLAHHTPTRTGYTFAGWANTEDAITPDYLPTAKVSMLSDEDGDTVNLYAVWTVNSYQLKFDTYETEYIFDYDEEINLSSYNPTRTGYTFLGWGLTSETTTITYTSSNVVEGLTSTNGAIFNLYAKWQENSYNLSLNTKFDLIELDYTEELDLSLYEPTKTGFTFMGWDTNEVASTVVYDLDETVSMLSCTNEDVYYLYAVWEVNSYTMTFNSNGGSIVTAITQNFDTTLETPSNPTKTGYEFAGWYKEEALTNAYTIPNKMPAESMTLYAKWEPVNVSYQLVVHKKDLDGNYSEVTTTIGKQGKSDSQTDYTAPIYPGFTLDEEASDGNKTITPDGHTTINLYYTRNTYKVFYFDSDNTTLLGEVNILYEDTIDEPADLTRIGYIFDKWLDVEGEEYVFGNEMGTTNVTLTASWTPISYNIAFNSNTEDESLTNMPISNLVKTYDEDLYITTVNKPSRTDYNFVGWATTSGATEGEFTDVIDVNLSTTNDATVTLYAIWQEKGKVQYTIEYYFENIINSRFTKNEELTEIKTISENTTASIFPVDKKNITGFTLDEDNDNAVTSGDAGAVNNSLILKLYYSRNVYTVSYYDISDNMMEAVNYKYGATIASKWYNAPVGYTFDKWCTTLERNTEFNPTTMGTENLSAYAKADLISYSLYTVDRFDNEGVEKEERTFNVTDTFNLPTRIHTGYTLTWYSESTYENVISFIPLNTARDVRVYAKWTAIPYNLTYVMNDGVLSGSQTNPSTYYYEDSTIILNNPSKVGHTFDGWTLTGSEITTPSKNMIIPNNSTGDMEFVAHFTPISYNILYFSPGIHTGSMEDTTCTYGENCQLRTNAFAKEGHSFEGWSLQSGGELAYADEEEILNLSAVSTDVGLYAVWSKNSYQIEFDPIGGTMPKTTYTQDYGTTLNVTNPNLLGQEFKGWYREAELINEYTLPETMPAENLRLYAKWLIKTYSIYYVLNGGINNINNPSSFTIISSPITLEPVSKSGYTFNGWILQGDSTQTVHPSITIPTGSTGTRTYIANYTPNTYTIAFNNNGGNGEMSNLMCTYGEYCDLTANTFTKTGKYFLGWAKEASDTTPDYLDEASVKNVVSGGTKTLYALWGDVPKRNVTFDYMDGRGSSSIILVNDGGTVPIPENPSKFHYVFDKWVTSTCVAEATEDTKEIGTYGCSATTYPLLTEYDFDTAIHEDTVIYATYNPEAITIQFSAAGGMGIMNNQTCYYGVPCQLNAVDSYYFYKTGHSFVGWTEISDSNEVFALDNETITLTPIADTTITLFAIWSPIKYTIAFNNNGGFGEMNSIDCTYDTNCKLTDNSFTKEGHRFVGWSDTETGSSMYNDGEPVMNLANSASTITLYAVWEELNYEVIYVKNNNDATGEMSTNSDIYSNISNIRLMTPAFELTGKRVTSWNTLADGTGTTFALDDEVLDINDFDSNQKLTLYAIWEDQLFTVRVHGYRYDCVRDETSECRVPLEYYYSETTDDLGNIFPYNQTIDQSLLDPYKVRPGYEFAGFRIVTHHGHIDPDTFNWIEEPNTYEPYSASTRITSDIELEAIYTEKTYNVEIYYRYPNSSSTIADNTIINHRNSEDLELPVPTLEGYIFEGYTATPTNTEPDELLYYNSDQGDSTMSIMYEHQGEGALKLYGLWREEQIYYQLHGYGYQCQYSEGGPDSPATCNLDEHGNIIFSEHNNTSYNFETIDKKDFTADIFENQDFIKMFQTRTGYTFDGWYPKIIMQEEGCNEDTETNYCIDGMYTSKEKYEFFTCSANTLENTYNTEETCTAASGNWVLKNIQNDVSLVARFIPLNLTVNFDLNGATGTTPTEINIMPGDSVTLPNLSDITPPTNASFVGWSVYQDYCSEFDGGCYVLDEGTINVNSFRVDGAEIINNEFTLYAIWEYTTYDIYWNPNNGNDYTLEQLEEMGLKSTITEGVAAQTLGTDDLIAKGIAVPSDKRLYAWSEYDPQYGEYFPADELIPGEYIGTSNSRYVVLNAFYANLTMNITYDLDDGQLEEANDGDTTAIYNQNIKLPSVIPEKDGYTFRGWQIQGLYNDDGYLTFAAGEEVLFDFDASGDEIEIIALYLPEWFNPDVTSNTISSQESLETLSEVLSYINQYKSDTEYTIIITNDSNGVPLDFRYNLNISNNITLVVPDNNTLSINNTSSLGVSGTIKLYLKDDNYLNYTGYGLTINNDGKLIVNDTFEYIGLNGIFKLAPLSDYSSSSISLSSNENGFGYNIMGDVTIDNNNYFNENFEENAFVLGSMESIAINNGTLTINYPTVIWGSLYGFGEIVINDLDNEGPLKTLTIMPLGRISPSISIPEESLTEIEEILLDS